MGAMKTIGSWICCCAGLAALSAATTLAADVVDDGKFFSADTVRVASEKIEELDRLHGCRVRVETISTLPDGQSETVRQMSAGDRAKFFGHFLAKRAAAEKLDLLIFASRDPKYLQVLPHKQLETAGFTTAMRDKIASTLIAGFHAQKYDESLFEALVQLGQDLPTLHGKTSEAARSHAAPMAFPVERFPSSSRPAVDGFGRLCW